MGFRTFDVRSGILLKSEFLISRFFEIKDSNHQPRFNRGQIFKIKNISYLTSKHLFFLLSLLFLIYHLSSIISPVSKAFAQNTAGDLANLYDISDKAAVDGDILIFTKGKIIRANVSFSNQLFGVLQDKPELIYHAAGNNGKPVVRQGTAYVNVTNANGAIKKGDYITSSSKAGKGQKAAQSGYVIGFALSDLTGKSGKIPVVMRIEYAELTNTRSVVNLLDAFNVAAFQGASDTNKASELVKYISSGMIVMLSLLLSLFVFGRSISKSIDAIGRNPLARRAIQMSIIINAVFTIGIVVIAVAVAYIILRL